MPPSSSLPVLRHLVGQQQQRSLLALVDQRLSWQWTLEVEIVSLPRLLLARPFTDVKRRCGCMANRPCTAV
jgi:hypothetical protein